MLFPSNITSYIEVIYIFSLIEETADNLKVNNSATALFPHFDPGHDSDRTIQPALPISLEVCVGVSPVRVSTALSSSVDDPVVVLVMSFYSANPLVTNSWGVSIPVVVVCQTDREVISTLQLDINKTIVMLRVPGQFCHELSFGTALSETIYRNFIVI